MGYTYGHEIFSLALPPSPKDFQTKTNTVPNKRRHGRAPSIGRNTSFRSRGPDVSLYIAPCHMGHVWETKKLLSRMSHVARRKIMRLAVWRGEEQEHLSHGQGGQPGADVTEVSGRWG